MNIGYYIPGTNQYLDCTFNIQAKLHRALSYDVTKPVIVTVNSRVLRVEVFWPRIVPSLYRE